MRFVVLAIAALSSVSAFAGEPKAADECCQINLWTGEGVSLGNFIFPELNYQASAGSSTTDPESLAVGHHDPDRHGITQQSIEFALGVKLGQHVRLFGNYSVKIDQDDHWFDEFEEYYAVFSGLPWDVRIRGGRFYPVFGVHNTEHHHSIFFVDEYLANGRLVGEDHLTLYGGEVELPVLRSLPKGWSDRLTVSFGAIPVDRPEAEEESEAEFDAEGAHFQDWAAVADYTLTFNANRATRYTGGISGAWGHNEADRFTQLYALHFEYLWRPDGAETEACCGANAGEFFRWRTEAMLRHFGAEGERETTIETKIPAQPEQVAYVPVSRQIGVKFQGGVFFPVFQTFIERQVVRAAEPERTEVRAGTQELRDDFTQFGANTELSYGFPGGRFQAHLRGEYVSGTAQTGDVERWRVSPVLSWHPSPRLPFHFKLQYNYDHSPSFGDEHSIWAQFSFTWGDCCAHDR